MARRARQRRSVGRGARPGAGTAPDRWPARTLDAALTLAADFIDLKSPYTAGHSRRCAWLSAEAGAVLGLPEFEVAALRRAALVHEFGTTAISNAILRQAGGADPRRARPGRAPPADYRADAAPLAGAGPPEPGRVGAPRAGRRLGLPPPSAGHSTRRRRPRRGRRLRGAHRGSRGPARLVRRRRRGRAATAGVSGAAGEPGRADAVLAAAGHARARRPRPRHPGRSHRPRGRGAPACGPRPRRPPRSPPGCTSRPRPRTTTSSTSTRRSGCRPAAPRRCGRWNTGWSAAAWRSPPWLARIPMWWAILGSNPAGSSPPRATRGRVRAESRSVVDDSGLVGANDQLSPVPGTELREQVAHVRPDARTPGRHSRCREFAEACREPKLLPPLGLVPDLRLTGQDQGAALPP